MHLKIFLTDKGLTLVELLVTLAIVSIISVLIISNLFSGIKSFQNVNKQISLHDEANYVMTRLNSTIFEATDVQINTPYRNDPCTFTVKVTKKDPNKINDKETNISFKKGSGTSDFKVYMNDENILSDPFSIVCTDSVPAAISVDGNTVSIDITIQDNDTSRQIKLNNKVSFVKVE